MEGSVLLGIVLAIIGSTNLNVGKGVQKQKVHVFLEGRKMLRTPHRRDLGIWLLGLLLTATAAVPPRALGTVHSVRLIRAG